MRAFMTTLPQTPATNAATAVCDTLRASGFLAFLVGGCVRDLLLNRPLNDLDIATSATPDEIERVFEGRTIPVGKSFGVMLVKQAGHVFEVATFRTDGGYSDGRRPDHVAFSTPEHDAQRRDFTVNALFLDTATGEILDFTGGLADLATKTLRTIGNPADRFNEDHLRLLRAARFASVLEFSIHPETRAAVVELAPLLDTVAPERIAAEFFKGLCHAPKPSKFLELLDALKLLGRFLPEVCAMKGCEQPPQFHPEGDVWTHTCLMLDGLPPPPRDLGLALATLFHDLGKPPTAKIFPLDDGTERIRFMNHAHIGAGMAHYILSHRLRQPTALADEVAEMVRDHMTFHELRNMRPANLRRFLGKPTFPKALEVCRLDLLHSGGTLGHYEFAREKFEAFANEPVLPEPWIRGADLMAAGLEPGPRYGVLLKRAYDAQLENAHPDKASLLRALPGWVNE